MLAFGGEGQRGWVHTNLSGHACDLVPDWEQGYEDLLDLDDFELRRVDVALDTLRPHACHESVVEAHAAGFFTTRGRPPNMTRIEPSDPTKGRTVYVGERTSDKYFRGYEKGYELTKGFPAGSVSEIDGVPIGDMYRLELEIKAKCRPIPLDLIPRRDQYFAGAYPYLGQLLKAEPEILVGRPERAPRLDLAGALAQCRQQYGATLFTALVANYGDIGAVWQQIVGSEHNKALVAAGVLDVDHEVVHAR
jgi:phage replication initiation protein